MKHENGRLSLRAWCRSRGIPWATGQKAASAGRLSRDERGQVDPERADREWSANTRFKIDGRVPVVPTGTEAPGNGSPGDGRDGVLIAADDVLQIEQERELMLVGTLGRTMRRLGPRLVGRRAEEITAMLLGAIQACWASVGRRWDGKYGSQSGE